VEKGVTKGTSSHSTIFLSEEKHLGKKKEILARKKKLPILLQGKNQEMS